MALAPLRQPLGARRSHSFAGQLAGLLHPVSELRFIELALVDVEVADCLVLGCAGRERTRIALQEADQLYGRDVEHPIS